MQPVFLNVETPLFYPSKEGQDGVIGREDDGLRLLGCKGHCVHWLLSERPNYQWGLLCQLAEADAKGNQVNQGNQTAWKTDEGALSWCSVSPGQCSCMHTSLWLQWLLCVTVAFNWLITLHILLKLATSDCFLFPPNMKKTTTLGWQPPGIQLLQYRWKNAVCGPQGRLCWKINHILGKFDHCIIVSLWKLSGFLMLFRILSEPYFKYSHTKWGGGEKNKVDQKKILGGAPVAPPLSPPLVWPHFDPSCIARIEVWWI